MPGQLTFFLLLHFCAVLPPVLHRHGSAFGLPALLIPSLIIRTTRYQVIFPLLGPLSDPILPPYPLLPLDPLPP